jgi:capsular exopolysaccharide synthesis family protein
MSKIYEALTKVEEENEQGIHPDSSLARPDTIRESTAPEKGLPPAVGTFTPKEEEPLTPTFPEATSYGVFDEKLVALTDPQSVPAEQFKKIRTLISQLRMTKGYRIIMVTSALPQEGKTTISCNLAVTLTQGIDKEAILIDCDLRRPTVHYQFGFKGSPGLAEILEGRRKLSHAIHQVTGLRLKVIPAGRSLESASELLSSERMVHFLEELKTRYQDDYIILDSTPILLTAEIGALARHVDGIVLVLLAGETSRDLVKRATKEIPHDKVIGIVLNNVQAGDGYHYKYHHGYHHPSTRDDGDKKRFKKARHLIFT